MLLTKYLYLFTLRLFLWIVRCYETPTFPCFPFPKQAQFKRFKICIKPWELKQQESRGSTNLFRNMSCSIYLSLSVSLIFLLSIFLHFYFTRFIPYIIILLLLWTWWKPLMGTVQICVVYILHGKQGAHILQPGGTECCQTLADVAPREFHPTALLPPQKPPM